MNKNETPISLTLLLIIIFLIWVVSIFVLQVFINDLQDRGTFGDTFGVINSLFSGLALAGIIYTIYLQKKELGLQRKELEYTRKELKRSADAHETSLIYVNEQLRVANNPILEFKYYYGDFGVKNIEISNTSSNIAFDLDIWVFKTQYNSEVNIDSFRDKNIKQNIPNGVNQFIGEIIKDDGFDYWILFERGIYRILSNNSKIVISLKEYDLNIGFINVYIQYRDSLSNNYGQHVSFIKDGSDYSYSDVCYNPTVPSVKDRLDINCSDLSFKIPEGLKEIIENKEKWMYQTILKLDDMTNENRWPVVQLKL